MRIGTPLSPSATEIMTLGAGEFGKKTAGFVRPVT
jgi:hypothetical protein